MRRTGTAPMSDDPKTTPTQGSDASLESTPLLDSAPSLQAAPSTGRRRLHKAFGCARRVPGGVPSQHREWGHLHPHGRDLHPARDRRRRAVPRVHRGERAARGGGRKPGPTRARRRLGRGDPAAGAGSVAAPAARKSGGAAGTDLQPRAGSSDRRARPAAHDLARGRAHEDRRSARSRAHGQSQSLRRAARGAEGSSRGRDARASGAVPPDELRELRDRSHGHAGSARRGAQRAGGSLRPDGGRRSCGAVRGAGSRRRSRAPHRGDPGADPDAGSAQPGADVLVVRGHRHAACHERRGGRRGGL